MDTILGTISSMLTFDGNEVISLTLEKEQQLGDNPVYKLSVIIKEL